MSNAWMRLNVRWGILLIALSLIQFACSAAREQNREANFRNSVKTYNEKMRWQQYADASKFVPKKQRNAFLEFYEFKRDTLQVEEIRIVSTEVDEEDSLVANAKVLVTYFELPNPSVKKEFQDQTWKFNKDLERWQIDLPKIAPETPKNAPKKESHRLR